MNIGADNLSSFLFNSTFSCVQPRSIVAGASMEIGVHAQNRVAEDIKLEVGMLNKRLKMVERNVKSCQLISQPVTNIHAQVGSTYYLKLFEDIIQYK